MSVVGIRTQSSTNGTGEGAYTAAPRHHDLVHGPGVWWSHNATSLALSYLPTGASPNVAEAYVARGFVFVADDNGGANAWGNSTARTAFPVAFARAQGLCDDPIVISCASMGMIGASFIAAAHADTTVIKEIHGCVPVCDIADIHDNNLSGLAAGIESAHGGLSAYQAALPSINPVTLASSFSAIPVHIWYDETGGDPTIAVSTVEAFAAAHGNTTLHPMGPVGHALTQSFLDESAARLRSLLP